MVVSRRDFLATSGGAMLVPLSLRAAPAEAGEPHFFIHLSYFGGADNTCMFDARPADFKSRGKKADYIGRPPAVWTDDAGGRTLVADPFIRLGEHRDAFSILNGVRMAGGFDGHPQNQAMIQTGSAFGGTLFPVRLNDAGGLPLAFILDGRLRGLEANSMEWGAALDPAAAAGLGSAFREGGIAPPDSGLFRFLRERYGRWSRAGGSFASGAGLLQRSLEQGPELAERIAGLEEEPAGATGELMAGLVSAGQYFRNGLCRSVILTRNYPLDTHDTARAQQQPETFAAIAGEIDTLFRYLKTTAFDGAAGLSLLDVTTVLISTEFSRTYYQNGKSLDVTGTNHNPLTNSVVIGGKGIRPGRIIGASDLEAVDGENRFVNLSGAHLKQDRALIKPMGRVFDPVTLQARREEQPEEDRPEHYLNYHSVINTLYHLFGVDAAAALTPVRNGPRAPVLTGLLAP